MYVLADPDRTSMMFRTYEQVMDLYGQIYMLISMTVKIVAAYALDSTRNRSAAVSKMAFGNRMGVALDAQRRGKRLVRTCIWRSDC